MHTAQDIMNNKYMNFKNKFIINFDGYYLHMYINTLTLSKLSPQNRIHN